jgi:hypothetical protein
MTKAKISALAKKLGCQLFIERDYIEVVAPKGKVMKTIILYLISLTGILIASWQIQEIHLGWGYTLGVAGLIVAFFVAVNSLTKDTRK